MSELTTIRERFLREAERAVVGQDETLELLLVSLLAGGHVLLEGVPGTAKTLMAKTTAALLRAEFSRVQFTPDLMPSDILGTSVFDFQTGHFNLRRGPIFTNILLADEINRAPAKTQSALLEAMEERQVTLEGDRHRLPDLFMVVATQNPIEYEGTYPLPEAQLDRFFFKLLVDHPDAEVEQAILARYHHGFDARQLDALQLEPVIDEPTLASLRAGWQAVAVEPGVMTYITSIIRATRASADVLLGASPRAGIALLLGSKVLAALSGREYVLPDDVKRLALPVLRHRILLKPEAELEALTPDQVIQRLLAGVEVPR
ncbi:MAG TPA: MoxR family ATPase [Thermomicrobiales bacterium]|nr:MoxR family ATPase [Thermomicrobiales bacterium]